MPRHKGINTVRVQAILNKRNELELEALKIRNHLMDLTKDLDDEDAGKWTDRRLITDGLIELARQQIKGYKPPRTTRQSQIVNQLLLALEGAERLAEVLSKLDLTAARANPEWDEDAYQATQSLQSAGLRETAVKMFNSSNGSDIPDDW